MQFLEWKCLPVVRGLAPVRLRSSREPGFAVDLMKSGDRFWGCCATQRGQAPSPRGPYVVGFAGLYDGRL
ncbi:hypothetical protein AB7M29_001666 [Pseudomonas sp. F-14 TE3623]